MVGMDMGGHPGHSGLDQGTNHGGCSLGAVAVSLPVSADDPGHLGPTAILHDGRLHRADRSPVAAFQTDDPVQPFLLMVGEWPTTRSAYRLRMVSSVGGSPPM